MSEKELDAFLLNKFIGRSPAVQQVTALIRQFARSKAPILITGETGTGKELVAHASHYLSERRDGPFIPVNCGALPDNLIESELFGHTRGAFTDAKKQRLGLIREANGGTLFLDELEALSLRAQVALLRFLQDASFRSVGEEHTRRADVRLIAASNVDLRRLVEAGKYREDLLFQLNVLPIQLPPLRDRAGDMALLVEHLLAKAACAEGGAAKNVTVEAMTLLEAHLWPGNVRELEHVLLRAHLLCDGPAIHAHDLVRCSRSFRPVMGVAVVADRHRLCDAKRQAVREIESRFVERALAEACGNISAAARMCNMQRAVLSKLAKKYGHADARVAEVARPH